MRNLWLLFVVGLTTGFISEKLLVSSQSPSSMADDMYLEGRTSGDFPIDDEDSDVDGSGSGSGDYAFSDITDKEVFRRFFNFSKTTFSKEMPPVQPQPTEDSLHNSPTRAADSQNPPTTVKHTETTPSIFSQDNRDEEVPGIGPTADWFTHGTSPSSTSMPPSETNATEFSIDVSVTKDADEDNSLDKWVDPTAKDIVEEDLIKTDVNDILAMDGRDSRMHEVEAPEEVTSENVGMWERTEVLAAVIACGVVGFLCAVFLLLFLAYRMKKKDEGSYDLGDTKVPPTAYHKAPTKEFYA